jgi:hypothetical protein
MTQSESRLRQNLGVLILKKRICRIIGGFLWGCFVYGITPGLPHIRSVALAVLSGVAIFLIALSVCPDTESLNKREDQPSLEAPDEK